MNGKEEKGSCRILPVKTEDLLKIEMEQLNVIEDSIAIWHLGQAGAAIKSSSGTIIYFDPYLTKAIEQTEIGKKLGFYRNFPPPLQPHQVTNADYVFITHHHDDHLDPFTLKPLKDASPQSKFIISRAHINLLCEIGIEESRIIALNGNETYKSGGIEIHAIPAKHPDYDMDVDGNYPYLGYIVTLDKISFYHAGDTVLDRMMINEVKKHNIDIAYIPINGRDFFREEEGIVGNMNYQEALEFCQQINAGIVIPCHYDLFEKNYESPSYFVDHLYKFYRSQRFKMMVPGELFYYKK